MTFTIKDSQLSVKKIFKKKLDLSVLSSPFNKLKPIKILSDWDDTFICSGGLFGNVDTRYPKDLAYPGVSSFYRELAPNECHPKRYGNLIFISARPEVTRQQITARFDYYFQTGVIHTKPMILYGNMKSMTGVPLKNFNEIAKKKFKNFKKYVKLYPEYDFIFVGDNGQADALVGELMLQSKYSKHIKGVFIQKVKSRKIFGEKLESSTEWKQIYFFDNYVDAATRAYQQKID